MEERKGFPHRLNDSRNISRENKSHYYLIDMLKRASSKSLWVCHQSRSTNRNRDAPDDLLWVLNRLRSCAVLFRGLESGPARARLLSAGGKDTPPSLPARSRAWSGHLEAALGGFICAPNSILQRTDGVQKPAGYLRRDCGTAWRRIRLRNGAILGGITLPIPRRYRR